MTVDRSEVYIGMCRAAEDVQELWRPAHGDFYLDEDGRVTCWVEPGPDQRRGGFLVRREGAVIRMSRYVWLPRQDQLIELAQEPGRRFERTTQVFFDWVKAPYTDGKSPPSEEFASLEQLWLGFVMQRKFFRRWDGSAWARMPLWPV